MPKVDREFVPNQVFIGLPWKNVRPRYDRIVDRLRNRYPLYFTIVGRGDAQDAEDLFQVIKSRIASSSYAIFDATGGNANVSLEFGYAEGIDVPRAIYLSTHKAAQRGATAPIISDLGGQRRVQYKTEKGLAIELNRFCREHSYTVRFEKALTKAQKGLSKGAKKSSRALALKLVRELDGRVDVRQPELVQALQAQVYKEGQIDRMMRKLHTAGVINCSVGRNSRVKIT